MARFTIPRNAADADNLASELGELASFDFDLLLADRLWLVRPPRSVGLRWGPGGE
jgi:hypothetical protein